MDYSKKSKPKQCLKNMHASSQTSVLIIRPGALGDTLMLVPAVKYLKDKVKIYIAGTSPAISLLDRFTIKNYDMDSSGWHKLFMNASDRSLNFDPFDIIISFINDRDGLINKALKRWFPDSKINIFPSQPVEKKQIHTAFHIASCINSAGIPVNAEESINNSINFAVLSMNIRYNKSGPIVIHPGSGSIKKNMPISFWENISYTVGKDVIVLLGPAEIERKINFFILKNNIKILRMPELNYLTEVLTGASLFIGHDSGVAHLAAMLGIPVIALFKVSDPVKWRPLGPHVYIIDANKELAIIHEELIVLMRKLSVY